MSKYTRLNKINHYHDSGSSNQDPRMIPPLCSSNNTITPQTKLMMRKMPSINEEGDLYKHSKNGPNENIVATTTKTNIVRRIQRKQKLANINLHNYSKLVQYNNLKLAFFFAAFIVSLLLIMLVSINGVHSLNCYHCSSVDNPECDEAFTGKSNITDTDCEKHIGGRPVKVCRKIVQYIEAKKVVIRSCGYIDEHEEKDKKPMCYKRSGTFAIMMESCNCYTDNCNHSASLVPNQSVSLAAICFVMLFYLVQSSLFNTNDTKRLR